MNTMKSCVLCLTVPFILACAVENKDAEGGAGLGGNKATEGEGGGSSVAGEAGVDEGQGGTTPVEAGQGGSTGTVDGAGGAVGTGQSSCVTGVQTGSPCDPAIDTTDCVRRSRTCVCEAAGNWTCTSTGAGSAGSGGSLAGTGGSETGAGGAGAGGSPAGTGGSGDCVPDITCTPTAPDTGDVYADCVARVNQFRSCMCLPALERNTEAESCADQQAAYDAEQDSAHAGFSDGICDPGGWAQNECPGWGSEAESVDGCIQMMFNEGPPPTADCTGSCYQTYGHFINITGDYTQVACGFATTADGEVWALQNFF